MPQKPGDWGSARTGDDEGTELGGLGLGLDAAVVGGEGKTGKCRPSQRVQSTYPWPWIDLSGCQAGVQKIKGSFLTSSPFLPGHCVHLVFLLPLWLLGLSLFIWLGGSTLLDL